ncbi:AI-2E family transporter [Microvirga lenta]|uniref:AI-2E family transporter n=1 Tax=Microvirga lenta TaxID=2881337 RepID=UPI001CFF9A32|nr:AI-2E family transporter [Microvirga lenta]MCB5177537.1 AI-2E family transporter [Microvirga lenta]
MILFGGVQPATREYLRAASRLMIATGIVVLLILLAWQLTDVLLLAFGAILVAILLRSLADLIDAYTPAHGNWSLLAAGLIILAALVAFSLVLGSQVWAQALELIERLPEILRSLEERFGLRNVETWVAERLRNMMDGGAVSQVAGYTSVVLGAAANFFLVLVAGIYLAIRPGFYRRGFLKLFPPKHRHMADETFAATARALRLWLVGQLAAMFLVGLLTGLGLWWLGIPSAMALGLLAGVAEFIPFLGPILAAIPAILLALSQDTTTALWVAGLYLLIQQMEGNLITPLVQQRAVDLPPVITLLAIVAFGVLFGTLGVLLATPLAVVALVVVKKLWVREALDEETELPGENEDEDVSIRTKPDT